MSDIVARLRDSVTQCRALDRSQLLEEAAAEVERLRSLTRFQDGVVRLPPLDPNGAPGWNAAIGAVREALAEAGVDWDTE